MTTEVSAPVVGRIVPGYSVPVVNEREVRAGAVVLFVAGAVSFGFAVAAWDPSLMKPFGFVFMFDMLARTSFGEGWAPSLIIGRLLAGSRPPQWVGAKAKAFAWYLGLGMAMAACFTMGWLAAPAWVTLAICGVCMSMLFLEAAFGICVGCHLQRVFSRTAPQHCPGGNCPVHSSDNRGNHVS